VKPSLSKEKIKGENGAPEADAVTRRKFRWPRWGLSKANFRTAKRIVAVVIGSTVTLIGVALLVLPGPAFIVIPIGLSILATEFLWARRLLKKAREMATNLVSDQPPKDKP